jgi:hypothetical protein
MKIVICNDREETIELEQNSTKELEDITLKRYKCYNNNIVHDMLEIAMVTEYILLKHDHNYKMLKEVTYDTINKDTLLFADNDPYDKYHWSN